MGKLFRHLKWLANYPRSNQKTAGNPMPNTRAAGAAAERRALTFLENRGLELVESNYAWRRGEIDLIMLHGSCLVFVEVRMRNHAGFGSGADTVGPNKMRKISATAEHFLANHRIPGNLDCRFDVISVDENID